MIFSVFLQVLRLCGVACRALISGIDRLFGNMDSTNIDDRIIEDVIHDCFWGDYDYTAGDIRNELSAGGERFKLFLFTKILDNSRYPSKYIRALFTEDEVRFFLSKVKGRLNDRAVLRRQLVMTNVLGEHVEIKGLRWRRT